MNAETSNEINYFMMHYNNNDLINMIVYLHNSFDTGFRSIAFGVDVSNPLELGKSETHY